MPDRYDQVYAFRRAIDANGDPVSGAEATITDEGTSNARTVYTTSALSVAHPDPLVADSNGDWPQIWAAAGVNIKVDVVDPDTQASLPNYPIDNVTGIASASTNASNITFTPTTDISASDVQNAIEDLADIAGRTALTAPAAGDFLLTDDVSATALRAITWQNALAVVDGITAETAPATGDKVLIHDASASAARGMVLSDLLAVINGLTEDTTPDTAADFLLSYDASASAVKKVAMDNASVAALERISKTTISAAATVEFLPPDSTTYDYYVITLAGVFPATDNQTLQFEVSDDGGSTWKTGASDYKYAYQKLEMGSVSSVSDVSDDLNTFIQLAGTVSNVTSEGGVNFRITILAPHDAGVKTQVHWIGSAEDLSGGTDAINGAGFYLTAADTDGFRIRFASGNVASGTAIFEGGRV